jgi:8-oxo-dGTP pyrophosphatase MutT (NUDIX family)
MARETAAACIAVREGPQGTEVCLVQNGEQWSVPWSLLGKGEIPKQTALRALREQTGIQAGLVDVDGRYYRTFEQVYRKGIDKVRREVHVFKVKVPGEPSGGHWLPTTEGCAKVTSKSVREAMEHALGLAKPAETKAPAAPTFEES